MFFTMSTITSELLLFALVFFVNSAHCFDLIHEACDEYEAFTRQPYFVDKTKFLSSFFREEMDAKKTKNAKMAALFHQHIITTPPGFGKTSILRMVKAYAQVELTENFLAKPKNQTRAYKIFPSLKVSLTNRAVELSMGEYYVLSIDLQFSPDQLVDENAALDALRDKIKKLYQEYEFIVPRVKENSDRKFINKSLHGRLDRKEIVDSLITLVYALRRDVGKREVVLLVDNYDSLIWYLIKEPKYYIKSVDQLVRDMLLELTYRRMRVKHSVFFGVTNFNFYDPQSSKTRHFLYYSFLNNGRFQNYFGFTPLEFETLVGKYRCSGPEKDKMSKYYRPYISSEKKSLLYNPTSIVNYLLSKPNASHTGKFEPYWGRNQSIDFLLDFARTPIFGEKLKKLIIRGRMKYPAYIRYHLPTIFIRFLESAERKYEDLHEDDVGDLFIFLHECGFVSASDETPDSRIYRVPNTEVVETLKDKILVKLK